MEPTQITWYTKVWQETIEWTVAKQTGKWTMDKRSVIITWHFTKMLKRVVREVTLTSEQDVEQI